MAKIQESVAELQERVDASTLQYQEAVEKKQAVEADAQACLDKQRRAEQLVNGLSSENKRWKKNVGFLKRESDKIVGNALLASAFVSYIPAFSAPFRL